PTTSVGDFPLTLVLLQQDIYGAVLPRLRDAPGRHPPRARRRSSPSREWTARCAGRRLPTGRVHWPITRGTRTIRLRSRLDLLETRRRLIVLRSLNSHDRRVTSLINKLIVKIGHLTEPENFAHEKSLRHTITRTFAAVHKIASRTPGD